ncbi:MAG: response regulator [Deltaproteobacteria bacterium]|nr:response regulator [Deltaproteobacteria bacterium]
MTSRSRPTTSTLAALGRTAGGVAHDVDNALTAIVTHATLIRERSQDGEAVRHAEAILRAARAASEVVERVRGALRESTRASRRVQVDLGALVDEALVVVAARAARRGVEVERVTIGEAAPVVAGQPAELLQLVINLTNNAIDASPPGEVVTIELAVGLGEVVFAVHDRGPGIPPALRERVLEPFFTTKGDAGTGLGLALAASIAESHGGALTIACDPGTVVSVVLPLAPPDAPSAPPPTDVALDAAGVGGRVLLVDDDDATREALALLIDAAGFEVVAVRSASEALVRFHATRPDVVITDLQLGAEDGGELVVTLGALDALVPIVVASGVADRERGSAWRRRAHAIFDKPISPGRLLATVRELVARRRGLAAKEGR